MKDKTRYARAIVCATMIELGVSFDDLSGPSRTPTFVLAREIISYLARKHTDVSYPTIARLMGKTTHSSIIFMERRMEKHLDDYKATVATILCRAMLMNTGPDPVPDHAEDRRRAAIEREYSRQALKTHVVTRDLTRGGWR